MIRLILVAQAASEAAIAATSAKPMNRRQLRLNIVASLLGPVMVARAFRSAGTEATPRASWRGAPTARRPGRRPDWPRP